MYKVLFIDEESENFDDFEDYMEDSGMEIVTQLPLGGKEEMLECIFKINPDAIIVDYLLNDIKTDIDYNIPYTGVELIEAFSNIREGFPCFVLTSFDDDAITESEDVNIVYIKNILHSSKEESKAKATFKDRVITQIEKYKKRIEYAQEELSKLLKLRKEGKAKYDDEQKIIELDDLLEKAIDNRNPIPSSFKKTSNLARLGEILGKVDEILDKLDTKDNE